MIAWFARNPVAANLLMLAILAIGWLSLQQHIPVEIFPRVEPRTISISTGLRGGSPEELEQSVSLRIEEAISDLEGIEEISSTSAEGYSVVRVKIDARADPERLLNQVKARIDALSTLPADIEGPTIDLPQWRDDVISVAITSPHGDRELREMAQRVRDDLIALDGVSQVDLAGAREYEVRIEIPAENLQRYQLSFETIASALRSASLDVTAGAVRSPTGEVLIRSQGQAYRQAQFEDLVVLTRADGTLLRLRDIAHVDDGFSEDRIIMRFNGLPAVMVDVGQVGFESPLQIARQVRDYVARQQARLPDGVTLTVWRDRSVVLEKRLQTLAENALQGGILVLILLTLFLRPAIALWVCVGIPVAFMGAFLAMPLFGATLNLITLFGFIVVLGIVVDDAIVTAENIHRRLRGGESALTACVEGTREVAVPVTFGVLTTMVAFLPIAFIEGYRGQLFAQIVVVVLPIFLFSLIESKLILPAHLRHLRSEPAPSSGGLLAWQARFSTGFERAVLRYYQPALTFVLRHRYAFLAGALGVLMILHAVLTSGWIRFVFFPRVQSEVATVTLTLPQGTPFEVTEVQAERMTEAVSDLREQYRDPVSGRSPVLDVLTVTGWASGEQGEHLARVLFEIVPPEERDSPVTSGELVNAWRDRIGPIPGAESLVFRAEIGRASDPIEIRLAGQDLATLKEVSARLQAFLARYDTVFDIGDTLSDGKDTFDLNPRPEAEALGLTRASILAQLRQGYLGLEVQRIQRGRDDLRVLLQYPEAERVSLDRLRDVLIQTPDGGLVPLDQLVELSQGRSPNAILRIDGARSLTVSADVDKQKVNMLLLERDIQAFLATLIPQYPGVQFHWKGEAEEQRESFGSLFSGLVFVLFAIYTLLAIPLRSYVQPVIVMSVIPFGLVGALAGHWLLGMDLTLVSLLGLLALVGVLVNDSLVLVDFVNQQRRQGCSTQSAILEAAAARFRPVVLTSLTTFIGLMPLLFERSTQAQFLIPMAVSLGFGILFATVLTLFLVPVNYQLIEDLRQWRRRSVETAPVAGDG